MIDQRVEEIKERKRRIIQRVIMSSFFGLFGMYFILTIFLSPLSIDTKVNGRLWLYVPNRTSALIVLPNKIFPVFENFPQFEKYVRIGDLLVKEAGSDTLIIIRKDEILKIKLINESNKLEGT
jgi:hypothetical protein